MRWAASAVSTRSAPSTSSPVARPAAEAVGPRCPSGRAPPPSCRYRRARRSRGCRRCSTSTPESGPSSCRAPELDVRRAADVRGADEQHAQRLSSGSSSPGLDRLATESGSSIERSRRRERGEHLVAAVLDRAAGGVDADVGVLGLLVGRGDAGELGDLAAAAPWRRGPCGRAARTPPAGWRRARGRRRHRPSSTMARTCCRVSSNGAIGLQTATPPWREISAATQPIRRMLVSRSSREKVSPAERFRRTTSPSRLVTVRSPCSSRGSISAWASVDLPLPDRPVKNSTSPCRVRRRAVGLDDRGDVVGVVASASRPRRPSGRAPGRRPA